MRIPTVRPGETRRTQKTDRPATTPKAGTFGALITPAEPPPSAEGAPLVDGIAPLPALDALLALQEVGPVGTATDESTAARVRALRRAEDILNALDKLRLALLGGGLSRRDLETLKTLMRQNRITSDDDRLNEILEEIELRAEVELAKLVRTSNDFTPCR